MLACFPTGRVLRGAAGGCDGGIDDFGRSGQTRAARAVAHAVMVALPASAVLRAGAGPHGRRGAPGAAVRGDRLGLVGARAGLAVFLWAIPVAVTFWARGLMSMVCHRWGARPHKTGDDSCNNLTVALRSWGEGGMITIMPIPKSRCSIPGWALKAIQVVTVDKEA